MQHLYPIVGFLLAIVFMKLFQKFFKETYEEFWWPSGGFGDYFLKAIAIAAITFLWPLVILFVSIILIIRVCKL